MSITIVPKLNLIFQSFLCSSTSNKWKQMIYGFPKKKNLVLYAVLLINLLSQTNYWWKAVVEGEHYLDWNTNGESVCLEQLIQWCEFKKEMLI